jgi:hypothetical protein
MSRLITPDGMRGGRGGAQPPQAMQIIDGGREPQLKTALLQGRIQNLVAPFMYHDAGKQFCFVLAPMEINVNDPQLQRVIGQMTQTLMRSLPEDAPRGYLLQPRTFFSLQSMMEAILEGDGITKDMLAEQQARVDVLRELIRTKDIEAQRKIARDNDARIDASVFELLSASMDANVQAGREAAAQQLNELQKILIEETTYGKVIGERLKVLEAFQKAPTRENLLEQLASSDDRETREMLLTVARQQLDYAFFQALTARIDATTDAAAKDKLVALRKEVQDTREKIDAAGRAFMQEKANLIQKIAASEDPMQTARDNDDQIDEAFLQVIQMSAQQAQQRGDANTLKALEAVNDIAMQIMTERQPPEVQIIQSLMQAEYPDETGKILEEVKEFADDRLIQVMIQYADQLSSQDRSDLAAKLTRVMVQARKILPKYDPSKDQGDEGDAGAPPSGGTPPPPPDAPSRPSGLIGADGVIRSSNEPPPSNMPKIEIARR